jgi:checkpoint serine/threonine-protein kinase
MEYCPQGTLLDAVNKARKHYSRMGATSVQGLVEPLAMFLTVRLLETVIVLHQNSFVHGDIKADNVMINFQSLVTDKSTKSAFLSYTGHDDNYWQLKQLKMIDFGRAIDLSLFPTGQKFVANWPTNVNDDPPQAQGRGEWEPWTLDYWGTAKAIHCLLFGQHMKVIPNANLWSIRHPMKRWWHTQIWNKTFNILLNPGRNLPITSTLIDIQQEMTNILIQRERKNGKRLSNMISELETILNG